MRPIRRALVAASVAGLLLGACGGIAGDGGPGDPPSDALEGRTFLSTGVTQDGADRPLVPGTQIRLGFADGQISIQAGCNSMGGGYALEAGVLRLQGSLSMTEMGCDPARHEQDAWISTFLGGEPRVRLEVDRLTLSGSGTVLELLDREVADPDRPLVGTRWHLDSIIEGEVVSSVPAGLGATVEFLGDGTVQVDSGCNAGGGPVTIGEETLSFGPIVLTTRGCEPDTTTLERQILEVLRGDVGYAIDGPVLSITADDLGLAWRA